MLGNLYKYSLHVNSWQIKLLIHYWLIFEGWFTLSLLSHLHAMLRQQSLSRSSCGMQVLPWCRVVRGLQEECAGEKGERQMLAESVLRTAITRVCKKKGFTFVDLACSCSQGNSAGHSKAVGIWRLSILLFFLSLLLLIGLCSFATLKKSRIHNCSDVASLSRSPSHISLLFT